MKLSINKKIINKNETKHLQSKGFEPFDITPLELSGYISQGFAFSYQFVGSYRKADNFICSDVIAADIDEGMTLEEALGNDFIVSNACLIYTTSSHTPENHRFRIVFQLPRTITDPEEIRIAQRGLARKLAADFAATDPARQFYGSKNCSPRLLDKVLSEDSFNLLLRLGSEPINLPDRQDNKSCFSGFRSTLTLDEDKEVRNHRGELVRLSTLESSKPIFCPYHEDRKPSAFTTKSKSGVMGIHCSTCQLTFWPKEKSPEPYDFQVFDKQVRKEVSEFVPSLIPDENGMVEHETSDPNVLVSERYLPKLDPQDGITLIKSPKGTGKTDYLKYLVGEYKKKKVSVLLVGHRRSLLRALSSSLGLDCYLDLGTEIVNPRKVSAQFAVSVDSLATMLMPTINKYDVVLIDESEQVFSHLISDTLNRERRRKCYLLLQHYIHVAKTVIALDADLNHVTLHAMQRFGTKNPFSDRRLVLNEYKFPQQLIELYPNENQLIGEVFKSIDDQQRIFICSNSKKTVDRLALAIKERHGDEFPLFWVTSDNSGNEDVKDFIAKIKTEILKYRVVLVSPAMGTGIDITFPDEVSEIDGVYGLFESRINTHFDIDQQLSRVRHPKFVRIWISPEHFNYETEIDPIKQELAESGIIPEVLKGYALTGLPEFDWNEPYLILYSTILSAQRASKNQLKNNFIELKTYNGWNAIEVQKDQEMISDGASHAKRGEELRKDEYISRILNADDIDANIADELKIKADAGKPLTTAEKNASDRYWIKKFYLVEKITTELLKKDNEGKFREQIRMLEAILATGRFSPKLSELGQKAELLRKLFASAGVFTSGKGFDDTVTITNDSLKDFVVLCKKSKVKIERVLDTSLRKDFAMKPVSQLGHFLGLCGLKTINEKPITIGNKKIYGYRLDDQALKDILAILAKRENHYHPEN